jgi:ABC-type multidrug transport system ATPase subunit
MIEAHDLVKRYGSTMAVNNLSFSIRPGMVTGFLGPNGAGKTTTMRMILGLDAPTQGSVTVAGRSYLMSEMALTAGHLLVIGKGKLIADTSVEEFVRSSSRQSVHVRSPQAAELAARCREAGATVRAGSASRAAAAPVAGPDAGTDPDVIEITGMDSAAVGRLAAAHGIVLFELIPVKASLEEAFMELTRDSVEYQAAGATR